jgi:hypothetical protein
MEPEGSLQYSQEPAIGPQPSQLNPVHTFAPYFVKSHLNNIILMMLIHCLVKKSAN